MAIITRLERKSRRWEQVWQGDAETLASIVSGRLESEGIQTRIVGSSTPYRATALALGGTWGILVPTGKAARARDVLFENDEGHNVIEPETETGLTGNQKATLRFAAFFAMALVLWALYAALKAQT